MAENDTKAMILQADRATSLLLDANLAKVAPDIYGMARELKGQSAAASALFHMQSGDAALNEGNKRAAAYLTSLSGYKGLMRQMRSVYHALKDDPELSGVIHDRIIEEQRLRDPRAQVANYVEQIQDIVRELNGLDLSSVVYKEKDALPGRRINRAFDDMEQEAIYKRVKEDLKRDLALQRVGPSRS